MLVTVRLELATLDYKTSAVSTEPHMPYNVIVYECRSTWFCKSTHSFARLTSYAFARRAKEKECISTFKIRDNKNFESEQSEHLRYKNVMINTNITVLLFSLIHLQVFSLQSIQPDLTKILKLPVKLVKSTGKILQQLNKIFPYLNNW